MKHPLAGTIRFFWNWKAWGTWGLAGPAPALPYDWRLFLGPLCIARVTTNEGSRWTRQRRRRLEAQLGRKSKKALRRQSGLVTIDIMLICSLAGIWFAAALAFMLKPTPAPELHAYTVVRFNPSQHPLLVATLMDGDNPKLIITKVLATSYVKEPETEDCYRFHFPGGADLICGIVHVADSGARTGLGIQ